MVQDLLARRARIPSAEILIKVIKTSGDRIQDRPLADIGGKGLFTKELDEALLAGEIDLAVHSMKDVATEIPPGTDIVTILAREDFRDRLITPNNDVRRLEKLAHGAHIGSSSLRRAAQIKYLRPDIIIVPFRGNVGTRLEKLSAGVADATILAAAGLNRLGKHELGHNLPVGEMLPAPAQGAVGIQIRADSTHRALVAELNDLETSEAVHMERAFLAALEGSCRTPIAALARWTETMEIELRGEALLPDGTEKISGTRRGDPSDHAAMARDLALDIRSRASPALRVLIG